MPAAAALLARAVTLTPDPVERGRRALAAAQAKMSSGSPNEALTLLSLAEATPLDEFHSAELYLRRGQLAFLVNRGRDAPSLLLKAAERFERLDAVVARDTYLEAGFAGLLAGRFAEGGGVRAVAQAIRRAPPAPQCARAVDLLVDGLGLFLTDGYAVGAPVLKLAIDAFASGDVPVQDQLRFGNIAAYGAQALWDERWAVISGRVLRLARESGFYRSCRSVSRSSVVVGCTRVTSRTQRCSWTSWKPSQRRPAPTVPHLEPSHSQPGVGGKRIRHRSWRDRQRPPSLGVRASYSRSSIGRQRCFTTDSGSTRRRSRQLPGSASRRTFGRLAGCPN